MVFFNSDSKKESKSFWLFKGRSKTTRLKPSKSLRNLSSKSDNSSALSSEGSTDLSRQSSIDKAADTHVSVSRQVSDCSYMSSGSFMSSGSSSVAQTSCSTPGLCSDDRFKSYLKKSHIRRRSSLEFACSSSSLVENKNNLLRTSSVSQQYGNKYLARYSPSNRSSLTVFTSQQQGKNRQTKGDGGSDKKWPRSGLARQLNRNNNEIQSDNETCGSVGCQSESPPAGDLRVANWSSSFEKLLEDSAALHTFAEFLKKEYSHENIYFWTACERYRLALSDGATHAAKVWSEWSGRHAAASAIYDTHLGPNAPEPVNVDSGARTAAKEGLSSPTQDLFAPAQKQIFNLMKFDSYSRFLKSSVYQECLDRENRGEPLQFSETRDLDPNLRIGPLSNDLGKGKSDIEERRRRSLLPWHRSKDRSKSKDRLAADRKRTNSVHKNKGKGKGADAPSGSSGSISLNRRPSDSSSDAVAAVGGSTSSLNHMEGAVRRAPSKESVTSSECLSLSGGEGGGGTSGRCRVVLPDKSESVVAVKSGISVERVMRRLLDRRGLKFLAFNITHSKTDKLIGSSEDSSVLNGTEVRLQQLVLFRLDLPSHKTVCVKAKPHKQATDVLRPILAKYGFKLDLMHIHTLEDPKPINVKAPITELDGQKYIVQTKEDVKEWGVTALNQQSTNSSLDVITNRVFEDLLHSKADHQLINDYDARSTKTDQDSDSCVPQRLAPVSKPNKAVEARPGTVPPGKDSDELYEGLKRAQMSRIEDQRGTEINSELPDFLKSDAENKRPLAVMDDNARLMNFFSQSNTYLHPNHQIESGAHHHTSHNHSIDYGDVPTTHNPSSLTQHQSHHNFWSDISAGGSSIPSSLLATSSSSLSSTSLHNFKDKSTLQNFHAKTSDGSLHTLDIDAVTFMATPHAGGGSHLDMQYRGHSFVDSHNTIVNNNRKHLRPRPESCVNILPSSRRSGLPIESIVNSVINSSRPKSSCGSLLNSINTNKYQGSENDLDETITPENVNDRRMQRPINRILDGVIKPPSLTKSSHPSPSIFSSPPPPLPPKPKLGIPPRGPPPRPPSRQLHSSHGMENAVADPISFV